MTINELIDRQIHPITGFLYRYKEGGNVDLERKRKRDREYKLRKKAEKNGSKGIKDR